MTLPALIEQLAETPLDVQARLDRHNALAARRFEDCRRRAGLPEDSPLAAMLAPAVLAIGEVRIEAGLELEVRREQRVGVDLRLAGRTWTAFLELTQRIRSSRGTRIEVHVERVPVRPPASRQATGKP